MHIVAIGLLLFLLQAARDHEILTMICNHRHFWILFLIFSLVNTQPADYDATASRLGAEEGVGREEEGGGGRSNRSIGHVIGGPCETECRIPHTICNAESQICECDPHFPILLHDTICTRPLKLGEACLQDKSCKYFDKNTHCASVDEYTTRCQCRANFYPSTTVESISRTSICIPKPDGPLLTTDVPTLIGVGAGLSVFAALTCMVFKLFSRARFSPARGYGDANLPPPSTPTEHKHIRRSSHNRKTSITDSELGAVDSKRRTSSINGVLPHSSGSFYERRQSLHSLVHAEKHFKAKESANCNQPGNHQETQAKAIELHSVATDC